MTTRDQDIYKFLNYSASFGASDFTGLFAKGQGSLSATFKEREQTRTVYVVLVGRKEFAGKQLKEATLAQNATSFVGDNFRRNCGTHYIFALSRHASVYTLLSFTGSDYDLFLQYTGQSSSSVNAGIFSANQDASLEATLSNRIKARNLQVQFESIGFKRDQAPRITLDGEADVVKQVYQYFDDVLTRLSENDVEAATGLQLRPYPDRPYELRFADDELIPARRQYEAALLLRDHASDGLSGKHDVLSALVKASPANRALLVDLEVSLNGKLKELRSYIECVAANRRKCPVRPAYIREQYQFPRYQEVRLRWRLVKNGTVTPSGQLYEFLRKDTASSTFRDRAGLAADTRGSLVAEIEVEQQGGTPIRPIYMAVSYYDKELYRTTLHGDWRRSILAMESTDGSAIELESKKDLPSWIREITKANFDKGAKPGPGGKNGVAAFVCIANADGLVWRMGLGGGNWTTVNFGRNDEAISFKSDYYFDNVADIGRACK